MTLRFPAHWPPRLPVIVVCLMLSGPLAGCTSRNGGTQEGSAAPGPEPPTAEFGGDTCGIEGWTHDDEMLPVPGVRVALKTRDGDGPNTTTDGMGRFAFDDLPPDDYSISVQKIGFEEPDPLPIPCPAGQLAETSIGLVPTSNPAVPNIWKAPPASGKICATHVLDATAGSDCSVVSPGRKDKFTFPGPPGNVTAWLFEMEWQQPTGIGSSGEYLKVSLPQWVHPGALNETNAQSVGNSGGWLTFSGTSPLRYRGWVEDPSGRPVMGPSQSQSLNITVSAAGVPRDQCAEDGAECQPAGAATEIRFDIYLEFYYWGEPSKPLDQHTLLPPE